MSEANPSFLGIHGHALAVREQRLQVLASNIANADTPGYKARDVDFQSALAAAMSPAGRIQGLHAVVQQAGYERAALQPSLDGNTVDSAQENAAFAQATIEYRASLSFVESKVRSMLTAITGQ